MAHITSFGYMHYLDSVKQAQELLKHENIPWDKLNGNHWNKPYGWLVSFLCAAADDSKYSRGGQSHSNWVTGLFADGVFLCANNHDVRIRLCEAPDISIGGACQDSRCFGNAWPMPRDGAWVELSQVPAAAMPRIDATLRMLIEEGIKSISRQCAKIAEQVERERLERAERTKTIAEAWTS